MRMRWDAEEVFNYLRSVGCPLFIPVRLVLPLQHGLHHNIISRHRSKLKAQGSRLKAPQYGRFSQALATEVLLSLPLATSATLELEHCLRGMRVKLT